MLRLHTDETVLQILECFGNSGDRAPTAADAEFRDGLSSQREDDLSTAEMHYQKALLQEPDHIGATFCWGVLRLQLGDAEGALRYMRHAVSRTVPNANTYVALGQMLRSLGLHEEALSVCRDAMALEGCPVEAYIEAGNACRSLSRLEEANQHYASAVNAFPHDASTFERLGIVLAELGSVDTSREALARAIACEPTKPCYYRSLASVAPEAALIHLEALVQMACRSAELTSPDRAELHFVLGQLYDHTKRYDLAAEHMLLANQFRKVAVPWHETDALRFMTRIREVFNPGFLCANTLKQQTRPVPMPVFIVGMPRSGSTLVEQILASHPSVSTIGESAALSKAVASIWQTEGDVASLDRISNASESELAECALSYLAKTQFAGGGVNCVLDKALTNFLYIGLIYISLPGAKIIHVNRHPLDTCLSCFNTFFAGVPYSNDLETLGRYYVAYSELMAYWETVLPVDQIIRVSYEDVVADLEGEARRLLQYCGLDWDDRCRGFYRNGRIVQTASVVQVRKPIYDTSIHRWKDYEAMLRPVAKIISAAGYDIFSMTSGPRGSCLDSSKVQNFQAPTRIQVQR